MRLLARLVTTLVVLGGILWCQTEHVHELTEEEIGSVHFSTTCSKTTETSFNRGIALLHSFQYELARKVFTHISGQDQNCARAYWGIGMSYYNHFANSIDLDGGRRALQKAQNLAGANRDTSAREKDYINALAETYRDGTDSSARVQGFEHKMRALQQAYPSDTEAAVFHALALAIAAAVSKTDKTYTNQRECGTILEPIFEKYPHHPGAAHYLIHCYDYPALAERGLVAARAYAKIAPASAHAQHMPSHIFTLLGLWDESINSNLNAVAIASKAEGSSTTVEARQYRLHSMDYLEYAYLQRGQVGQAGEVLSTLSRQIFVAHQQFFINSSGDVGQQAGPLHFRKRSSLFLLCYRAWGEAEFYPGETCESETAAGDYESRTSRLFNAFQFFDHSPRGIVA